MRCDSHMKGFFPICGCQRALMFKYWFWSVFSVCKCSRAVKVVSIYAELCEFLFFLGPTTIGSLYLSFSRKLDQRSPTLSTYHKSSILARQYGLLAHHLSRGQYTFHHRQQHYSATGSLSRYQNASSPKSRMSSQEATCWKP